MIADPVLVVVDMQNDYCRPGYRLDEQDGVSHMQSALEAMGSFLERYRASGRSPVLVRTTHDILTHSRRWDQLYEDKTFDMLCEPGTEGAAFAPQLDADEDDVVVTKHRYSAFFNTDLDVYLSANDASHLLIAGTTTDVCVESTVRDACNRDYDVTVLSDCTAASKPELREPTLERLGQYFAEIRSSGDVQLEELPDNAL